MEQSFEQAGKLGKGIGRYEPAEHLRHGQRHAEHRLRRRRFFQEILFETGSRAMEQMIAAKSPEKAMEIQAGLAKSAY